MKGLKEKIRVVLPPTLRSSSEPITSVVNRRKAALKHVWLDQHIRIQDDMEVLVLSWSFTELVCQNNENEAEIEDSLGTED